MKKIAFFAVPLIALVFAVACKKQEVAAPVEQPAATEAAPATDAAPATEAKPAEKKGN